MSAHRRSRAARRAPGTNVSAHARAPARAHTPTPAPAPPAKTTAHVAGLHSGFVGDGIPVEPRQSGGGQGRGRARAVLRAGPRPVQGGGRAWPTRDDHHRDGTASALSIKNDSVQRPCPTDNPHCHTDKWPSYRDGPCDRPVERIGRPGGAR